MSAAQKSVSTRSKPKKKTQHTAPPSREMRRAHELAVQAMEAAATGAPPDSLGNGVLYQTKRCPVCDEELFADMDVCYGCLYDFSREPRPIVMDDVPPFDPPYTTYFPARAHGGADDCADDGWVYNDTIPNDIAATAAYKTLAQSTSTHASPGVAVAHDDMHYVRVHNDGIDVTVCFSDELSIGRLELNDVVLHSKAVSRTHSCFRADHGQVYIEDRGATNPARLRGRAISAPVAVHRGDHVDVCGTIFTLIS